MGNQGVQGIQGRKGDKGNQGNQGAQGPQGPAGSLAQATLPLYKATIPQFSINWPAAGVADGYEGGFSTSSFSPVILFPGAVACSITLPNPGTYWLLARCGDGATPLSVGPGLTGLQANPGINEFKIHNVTTNADLAQTVSDIYTTGLITGFVSTVTPNNVIQIYAKSISGAAVVSVHYFWAFKIS
jgi:hypothetical protein